MKIHRGNSYLQVKERDCRRNQSCQHLDHGLAASRATRNKFHSLSHKSMVFYLFVYQNMYVYVVCTCMFTCVHVCKWTGVWVYMWRPEVDVGYFLNSSSFYLLRQDLQLNPELTDSASPASQFAWRIQFSFLDCWDYRWAAIPNKLSTWVLGILTLMFVFAWKVLYPLGHLHSKL